jgi:predicted short-subunit dehydrogenase-like oxidoreductase (DUF2520 family)
MSEMSELRLNKFLKENDLLKRKSFSCIGAGRAGSSLCRLLSYHLKLNQVINPTVRSAEAAVEFIGGGEAIGIDTQDYKQFKHSDLWMITCPDEQIQSVGERLIRSGIIVSGNIIFHCSGALSSSIWEIPDNVKIGVASVHPIQSFVRSHVSVDNLTHFHCAIEGDIAATTILSELFELIGATLHKVDLETKSLYHAGTVMASNYLVSLLELSQIMLQTAGIKQDKKHNLLQPLIEQTLSNYLNSDAPKALTGPISRGDVDTIKSHLLALESQSEIWRDIYIGLGRVTLDIAVKQGSTTGGLNEISYLLDKSSNSSDQKYKNDD